MTSVMTQVLRNSTTIGKALTKLSKDADFRAKAPVDASKIASLANWYDKRGLTPAQKELAWKLLNTHSGYIEKLAQKRVALNVVTPVVETIESEIGFSETYVPEDEEFDANEIGENN